jgi:hypothetical protein
MVVAVDCFSHFGLIKGELLSTDGQLEPSYSRYKGCTYACKDCQAFTLSEADRQALGEQLQRGAKRLQLTCPFPEAVAKVREATAKKGTPKDPIVTLLEIETVPEDKASLPQRQHVAKLLGLPQDKVPPLRLKWCHLSQGANGALVGNCPKMPSDLEAKIGVHVDTKNPSKKEEVFGYVHLKTTDLHPELPWATLPTPRTPKRAPRLSLIVLNWPSRFGPGRCISGTRLTMTPPTTSGFMSRAPLPSLTITGATSTSMRPHC